MSTRMNRAGVATLLAVICCAMAAPLSGGAQGGVTSLSGRLIRYEDLEQEAIPIGGSLEAAMVSLDYDVDEMPLVYSEDFDGDGVPDYLMGSPEGRLCGTAGCPYVFIDGASLDTLGEFFGTVAVLDGKVNQFPVIQTVSRRDFETTNLNTFVFDGEVYRLVSHALLGSAGTDAWIETLAPER